MSRFVIVSFALLGWAFYELSGGSDFEPRAQRVVVEPTVVAIEANPRDVGTISFARAEATPVVQTAALLPTAADPAPTTEIKVPAVKALSLVALEDSTVAFSNPLTVFSPGQEQRVVAVEEQFDSFEEPQVDLRSVTGNRVNMRTGPGTTYSVVAKLDRGTQVHVLADPGNGWVKLRPADGGPIGWMTASLVSQTQN